MPKPININIMKHNEFSLFATDSIHIRFNCNKCKGDVWSPEIKNDSHIFSSNDIIAECSKCKKKFKMILSPTNTGGIAQVEGVSDDDIIQIIEQFTILDDYVNEQIDTILSDTNFITQFRREIENLRLLSRTEVQTNTLKKTLLRQLYSSSITCLEDYLSSTLINQVINSDKVFREFISSYQGIKNRKFNLNEIFEKYDQLKDIAKKELVELIYHDLPKIKGIYEDSLEIQFPEITEIMKIINTRHDMVHRNGKNKEGQEIEISDETVNDVITKVEIFVNEIDKRIQNK